MQNIIYLFISVLEWKFFAGERFPLKRFIQLTLLYLKFCLLNSPKYCFTRLYYLTIIEHSLCGNKNMTAVCLYNIIDCIIYNIIINHIIESYLSLSGPHQVCAWSVPTRFRCPLRTHCWPPECKCHYECVWEWPAADSRGTPYLWFHGFQSWCTAAPPAAFPHGTSVDQASGCPSQWKGCTSPGSTQAGTAAL